LRRTLASLGIFLKEKHFNLNVKPLLQLVLSHFFGPSTGFVEMVVQHIPSPSENAETKVRDIYTGDLDTEVATAMINCDADGPLMIHITKLYNNVEATGFDAFGRVMSGTIKRGQTVRVLGEGYSIDDEEDMSMQQVSDVWINESR
jgi:U5 small nuclear ribonucleoprotein component